MGNALALAGQPMALARVEPRSMPEVFELAGQLAKARGFVPDAYVGNPAAIAACILTGMELGLGAMQSMRDIFLVKGRPSLSAALMLSLARRSGVKTRWLETTNEKATIGVTVPGQAEQTLSFTKADAERAKLWGQQGPWSQYPATMLRARCISGAIRAFCPDVLGGGSVYESDSGEITDGVPTAEYVDAHVVEAPQSAKAAPPKTQRPRLADCTDAAALRAWCEAWGEAAMKAGKADAIMVRAEDLNVPAAEVRVWLGIVETPADDFDPSEQDAPPPEDR